MTDGRPGFCLPEDITRKFEEMMRRVEADRLRGPPGGGDPGRVDEFDDAMLPPAPLDPDSAARRRRDELLRDVFG